MDAESFERDAVKPVFFGHVCSGSKPLNLKVTPPSLLPNSSAVRVSCLSFPPFLKLKDLVILFYFFSPPTNILTHLVARVLMANLTIVVL